LKILISFKVLLKKALFKNLQAKCKLHFGTEQQIIVKNNLAIYKYKYPKTWNSLQFIQKKKKVFFNRKNLENKIKTFGVFIIIGEK
jgi:hypothetical protein